MCARARACMRVCLTCSLPNPFTVSKAVSGAASFKKKTKKKKEVKPSRNAASENCVPRKDSGEAGLEAGSCGT